MMTIMTMMTINTMMTTMMMVMVMVMTIKKMVMVMITCTCMHFFGFYDFFSYSGDTTRPSIIYCPDDIETAIEEGLETNGTIVTWNQPNATDLSGPLNLTQSHKPNTTFTVGVTMVTYEFTDTSNNIADCSFLVIVERGTFDCFHYFIFFIFFSFFVE